MNSSPAGDRRSVKRDTKEKPLPQYSRKKHIFRKIGIHF
jgi:hypothetical protein